MNTGAAQPSWQAQGELETAAIRHFYAKAGLPLHALPATAREMVAAWQTAAPAEADALPRRPSLRAAADVLRGSPISVRDAGPHTTLLDITLARATASGQHGAAFVRQDS